MGFFDKFDTLSAPSGSGGIVITLKDGETTIRVRSSKNEDTGETVEYLTGYAHQTFTNGKDSIELSLGWSLWNPTNMDLNFVKELNKVRTENDERSKVLMPRVELWGGTDPNSGSDVRHMRYEEIVNGLKAWANGEQDDPFAEVSADDLSYWGVQTEGREGELLETPILRPKTSSELGEVAKSSLRVNSITLARKNSLGELVTRTLVPERIGREDGERVQDTKPESKGF